MMADNIDTKTDNAHVIERTLTFSADTSAVWRYVRDFGLLLRPADAGPPPTLTGDPQSPGTERHFAIDGGALIKERLLAIDDDERVLEYSIVDPPFPISDHHAVLRVHSTLTGLVTIVWRAEFHATSETASALTPMMIESFDSILRGIARSATGDTASATSSG